VLFLLFVALMFFVSLMFLFGYHCWLVAKNRSTLGEETFTSFVLDSLIIIYPFIVFLQDV